LQPGAIYEQHLRTAMTDAIWERLFLTGPIFVTGKQKEMLPSSIIADIKEKFVEAGTPLHKDERHFLKSGVSCNCFFSKKTTT